MESEVITIGGVVLPKAQSRDNILEQGFNLIEFKDGGYTLGIKDIKIGRGSYGGEYIVYKGKTGAQEFLLHAVRQLVPIEIPESELEIEIGKSNSLRRIQTVGGERFLHERIVRNKEQLVVYEKSDGHYTPKELYEMKIIFYQAVQIAQ